MQKGLDSGEEDFYNLSRCLHDGLILMELHVKPVWV